MIFNNELLYKDYKKITKTCILDGHPIPVLIRDYEIPTEYKYTVKEKQKYYNQLSTETQKKLGDRIRTRRETELSILRKENKEYENVFEYYEKELYSFIDEYSQFKKIIK